MKKRLDMWLLAAYDRREDNRVRAPEHIGGQPDGIRRTQVPKINLTQGVLTSGRNACD